MKYVLHEEKLEPLDIILTKNNKFISKGVRFFTKGDYSHALVYISNYSAIEATREGRVFSENIQRLVFDSLDECRVLRCRQKMTEKQSEKIAYYARMQVTTLYSLKEAVRVKTLIKKDIDAMERTQFCSRLVAQAYSYAGLDLTNNTNYCSPQDLNNSELLFEVKDVLKEATDMDLALASTPSPIKENAKQLYQWLDKAATLAKTEDVDILSQSDVEKFIITYPLYDKEICSYIQNTDYLNFYDNDEKVNPLRYTFDPDINFVVVTEFELCTSNTQRFLINYARSKSIFLATNLEYFKLKVRLFENLLDQCIKHLNVIIQHTMAKIAEESDIQKKAYMYIYKSHMDALAEDIRNARDREGYLAYIQPDLI